MILQAAVDESYTAEGTFVLAGYIAPAEAWAQFSQEWVLLLPITTRAGRTRFKMSEMARRLRDVQPFYRTIEKYVSMSISFKINLKDLRRAINRIWVPGLRLEWKDTDDPHYLCFYYLLDGFHCGRSTGQHPQSFQNILSENVVDFYFDDHSKKKSILDGWDEFMSDNDERTRSLYGITPRFENDEKFLPLQAADFWAWWVRRGYETNTLANLETGDFGEWKEHVHIPWIQMWCDEDFLVAGLIKIARKYIEPERPILDTKYNEVRNQKEDHKIYLPKVFCNWSQSL